MVILKILSWTGLLLTVGPSFLVFARVMDWETHAGLMILGTIIWFSTAPFWMKTRRLD